MKVSAKKKKPQTQHLDTEKTDTLMKEFLIVKSLSH